MKIKMHTPEWLDIDKAEKFIDGGSEFIGWMPISEFTMAVFKAHKPDKKKGHKKYAMFFRTPLGVNITGRTSAQMKIASKIDTIACSKCDTALLSLHRHDMIYCDCKNATFVDGGNSYSRYGASDMSYVSFVTVDLLKNEVIKKKRTKK